MSRKNGRCRYPGLFLLLLFCLTGIIGIGPIVPIQAQLLSNGNDFYRVFVESDPDKRGIGTFAIITGPDHPAGRDLNVLYRYANGDVGSSFITIHSFSSDWNYVQRDPGTVDGTTWLNAYGRVDPLGTTGYRTTYTLPESSQTPDALTIVSDVHVQGTDFEDSQVIITTRVTNDGDTDIDIGIRYLWDFQVGKDDGPIFKPLTPNGTLLTSEQAFLSPNFESFQITDNDINPDPPTFSIFGTVNGPWSITPTPRSPDLLQYVSWRDAVRHPFTYQVNPDKLVAIDDNLTDNFLDDSATMHFFGHNSENALHLQPGQSVAVSGAIFAAPPAPLIITLEPSELVRRPGSTYSVRASVRNPGENPLEGQTIVFESSGAHAMTDESTTANDGTATFSYVGTNLGADTIMAWIDHNNNGVRDLTEPSDAARVRWEEPTAVTLIKFAATASYNTVIVQWETATEIDHAGFNLYRAASADGPYSPVTPTLIPGQGDAQSGAGYRYEDTPGQGTHYYVLEDIDRNGTRTTYGPVQVHVEAVSGNALRQLYLPLIVR